MLGWAFKAILGKVGGWALTKAWAITSADPVILVNLNNDFYS